MASFNKIVVVGATLVLIVSLIIVGVFVSKSLFENKFPPIISDCPDYWDVAYSNRNNVICKNKSTINAGSGKYGCNNYPTRRFRENGTNEEDVLCSKYKWSKKCGIVWDGVTNNSEPCSLANI
tara:strand:+ start:1045 stop:1413 length:369 start_codon:yes stop_codon:yes gene_type:complete